MPIYQMPWGRKSRRAQDASLPSMVRKIPTPHPQAWPARSSAGWRRSLPAGTVLGLLALLSLACSPGENSVVNPNTDRPGLIAPPETLEVSATADREHRPIIATGGSSLLRVAHTDSVEAIAFLRFTIPLADTAVSSGADLEVRLTGGVGSGLRVAAYEVLADTTIGMWGEPLLTLADTTRLVMNPPLSVSGDLINPPPVGETLFVASMVQIPDSILARWARQPSGNYGIALRLSPHSPDGAIEFLSRHGTPDSARVTLRYMRGDSAHVSLPTADAYVYLDRRPPVSGSDSTITIADWPPRRAIFQFPVLESLRGRYGSQSNRVHILRATLHLSAVSEPDSGVRLAAAGFTADWVEGTDPVVVDLVGTANSVLVEDVLTNPGLGVRLETGGVDGHVVRSVGELVTHARVSFFSSEAADNSRWPRLKVVYLPPLDPRWGPGGGK